VETPTTEPAAENKMSPQEVLDWRTQAVDEASALLASEPTSELRLRLIPMSLEELEAREGKLLESLQMVANLMADALIDQVRAVSTGGLENADIAEMERRIRLLREFRADLVTRANLVLQAIEDKGGDVASARAYVLAIDQLEPDANLIATTDETVPEEEKVAELDLAERVASAITEVREMPPVHERPEPWTISIEELSLELQPLRKEQIDERVQKWLDILQRNVRQRIRMDIAVNNTDDAALRDALAARSTEQQQIVAAIVERVNAALRLLKKRGGDTKEYADYVSNATGQKLNLTDPAVLMSQIKAWFSSPTGGIKIGISILKFLGILIAFWIVSRIVAGIVGAAVKRVPKTSSLLFGVLTGLTRRIIMLVGLVVGVGVLGVNIGPLVAAIGAAGLVIGLALQGTLSNFASGILILITRPYDVGDVIQGGGVFGKVHTMNLVSTSILTFDNQLMLVPNNEIWNGVITNVTARDTRRVDLVFGIGYGDDISKAQQVIEQVVTAHEKVLDSPAPTIRVHELADNSVNFVVRPWCKTPDYWDVYWDLTETIKRRFDEEGINIPFPQRDLHLSGPIDVVMRGANDVPSNA
jgi:small conductance mechanosensitive channel